MNVLLKASEKGIEMGGSVGKLKSQVRRQQSKA